MKFIKFLMIALICLNSATQAEFETLPGIGPVKAAAIVTYRTNHGNFTTVDELDNVPGFGAVTIENIRSLVTVDCGGEPPPEPRERKGKANPAIGLLLE